MDRKPHSRIHSLKAGSRRVERTSRESRRDIHRSAGRGVLEDAPDRSRWKQVASYGGATEQTIYAGGLVEKVTRGTQVSWRHSIVGGSGVVALYARNSSGGDTLHYLTKDHLGSIDTVSASTGAIELRLSFAGHGRRRNEATWTGNPTSGDWTQITSTTRHGFTGHEMLDNLNLTHMNGRVYDQLVGRFISPDPFIDGAGHTQGWNRYMYVKGGALSFTDPSGFGFCRTSKCTPVDLLRVDRSYDFSNAFGELGHRQWLASLDRSLFMDAIARAYPHDAMQHRHAYLHRFGPDLPAPVSVPAKQPGDPGRVAGTGGGFLPPMADNPEAGVVADPVTRMAIDASLAGANATLAGRYFGSEAAVATALHNALAAASDRHNVEFYADIYRIAGTRGRSLYVSGVVVTSYHSNTILNPVSPSTYRGPLTQSNSAEWHSHPGWTSDFSDPRSSPVAAATSLATFCEARTAMSRSQRETRSSCSTLAHFIRTMNSALRRL